MISFYERNPMSDEIATFLLRTTPAIKAAVKALAGAGYVVIHRRDGSPMLGSLAVNSMNDAFGALLEIGMSETLRILEENIDQTKKEHDALSELMMFFLTHPAAAVALPMNFEPGSAARQFIEELMESPEPFDE